MLGAVLYLQNDPCGSSANEKGRCVKSIRFTVQVSFARLLGWIDSLAVNVGTIIFLKSGIMTCRSIYNCSM